MPGNAVLSPPGLADAAGHCGLAGHRGDANRLAGAAQGSALLHGLRLPFPPKQGTNRVQLGALGWRGLRRAFGQFWRCFSGK